MLCHRWCDRQSCACRYGTLDRVLTWNWTASKGLSKREGVAWVAMDTFAEEALLGKSDGASSLSDSEEVSSFRFQALIRPDSDSWSDLGDMKSVSGSVPEAMSSDTLASGKDVTAYDFDFGGKSRPL